MEVGKRDGFGSQLGAIVATVGSAVGLGNVFRFPLVIIVIFINQWC